MGDFIRSENLDTDTHRGKTMQRHRGKTAVHKPRRGASGETNPVATLTSDFQPLELT